jgi:G3E family GTPase
MTTRLALIGGFLGSGKTTLVLDAVQRLARRGYRVGVITNDQGESLVDTKLGRQEGIPVCEIAGGCFCCRFPDLIAGLDGLRRASNPQIILAEAVGSCTDLVATVLKPLIQFYGEQYELAPLTVLLDPTRNTGELSSDVRYLYERQLAEAELLLLSKRDLLSVSALEAETRVQTAAWPQANVLAASGRTGAGVARWLDILLGRQSANPEALVIDYGRYARAEGALGWLNTRGQVRADRGYAMRAWVTALLESLRQACRADDIAIAHIKVLVEAPATQAKLKAGLTQSSSPISWDRAEDGLPVSAHEFLLNVRVNAAPAKLEEMVISAIEDAKPDPGSRYYLEQYECFSPMPPRRTVGIALES